MAKNSIISSMKAVRKQVEVEAKAEAKLEKMRKKLRKEQLSFRDDPRKLARAIADLIRADNRPGEDPDEYETKSMEDGFHWFQNAWGKVVIEDGTIAPLDSTITKDRHGDPLAGHKVFEVTCPTTGCVAGWAASLAGYPMALTNIYGGDFSSVVERNRGQVYQTDDCIDKDNNRLLSISDKGAELLNLDWDRKDWLFSGYRDLKDVLWALDQIAETGTFNPGDRPTSDENCSCNLCN